MRKGIFLLAGLLVTGCATSPVTLDHAKPVSPDRLYAFQGSAAANEGTLTVIRDAGFMGHGCGINILVDGVRAGFIGAGEMADFSVTAGDHILSVRPSDSGLCAVGSSAQERTIKATITAAHRTQFRVSIMSGGDVQVAQTSL
jgi:hypothetical protein